MIRFADLTANRFESPKSTSTREDPATSRYLTIHFTHGESVSTSPRHRIDSIPAGKLRVGDTCGSQTVIRVESVQGVSRSFDLLTEDPGYRIAGIPVNSMIEEMLGRRNSSNVRSALR